MQALWKAVLCLSRDIRGAPGTRLGMGDVHGPKFKKNKETEQIRAVRKSSTKVIFS